MKSFSRAIAVTLAAVLISGSVPREATAQVIRIATTQNVSVPLSANSAVNAAPSAALTPALGAASLNGSIAAPSMAPSIGSSISPFRRP
jgi:hypothetical protein